MRKAPLATRMITTGVTLFGVTLLLAGCVQPAHTTLEQMDPRSQFIQTSSSPHHGTFVNGPGQLGPGQFGTNQVGFNQFGNGHVGSNQLVQGPYGPVTNYQPPDPFAHARIPATFGPANTGHGRTAAYGGNSYGRPMHNRSLGAGFGQPPVTDVQRALRRLGLYYGPVNGVMGEGTLRAILNYQSRTGLPVDGRITPHLLNRLMADLGQGSGYGRTGLYQSGLGHGIAATPGVALTASR